MKKKTRFLATIFLILTMTLGSVLTVSAEETGGGGGASFGDPEENEDMFYNPDMETDENGKHEYLLWFKYYNSSGNYYIDKVHIITSHRIALVPHYWNNPDTYGNPNGLGVFCNAEYLPDGVPGRDYLFGYNIYNNAGDFEVFGTQSFYSADGELFWTKDTGYKTDFNIHPKYGTPDYMVSTTLPYFSDIDKAVAYLSNGDDSGVINKPPVTDNDLYLKNIRWKTESLTGQGGKEDCYCFMSWDTDNLTENDYLNVKTDSWYQHYILGDKILGSHFPIKEKQTDDFLSSTWSHSYSYELNLLNGSFCFDYLTFPMLFANTRESIDNIYNGGVNSMYFQLVRFDTSTNTWKEGLWVRVNFKENSVSYPDIDSIVGGNFDKDTGDFIKDPNTDYGENGYGVNGETGHIIPPFDMGSLDSIDEIGELIFSKIFSLFSYVGQLPSLLSKIYPFIPPEVISLIGLGILIVILLRILGR